jgi:TPP-dependent indolepyruvate ferredoxin oxidoreductase alpha subunit
VKTLPALPPDQRVLSTVMHQAINSRIDAGHESYDTNLLICLNLTLRTRNLAKRIVHDGVLAGNEAAFRYHRSQNLSESATMNHLRMPHACDDCMHNGSTIVSPRIERQQKRLATMLKERR